MPTLWLATHWSAPAFLTDYNTIFLVSLLKNQIEYLRNFFEKEPLNLRKLNTN